MRKKLAARLAQKSTACRPNQKLYHYTSQHHPHTHHRHHHRHPVPAPPPAAQQQSAAKLASFLGRFVDGSPSHPASQPVDTTMLDYRCRLEKNATQTAAILWRRTRHLGVVREHGRDARRKLFCVWDVQELVRPVGVGRWAHHTCRAAEARVSRPPGWAGFASSTRVESRESRVQPESDKQVQDLKWSRTGDQELGLGKHLAEHCWQQRFGSDDSCGLSAVVCGLSAVV